MTIVAFMPIRLNSKRVAGKTIRLLGGRPLFCWMLQELDALEIPAHVYCSDPDAIRHLMDFRPQNIFFTKRPERLDGDDVTGIEIYRQFAKDVPSDAYLLSHATSPFVTVETLRRTIEPVLSGKALCSLTVSRHQTFSWYDGRPLNFSLPRVQTQKIKPVFTETSAAYCYRAEVLAAGDRSDLSPELIEVKWPEDDDIDYEWDFERCDDYARRVAKDRMNAPKG